MEEEKHGMWSTSDAIHLEYKVKHCHNPQAFLSIRNVTYPILGELKRESESLSS